MGPVSTITPGVLATIAVDWSEAELHAAAAILTDLLRDRRGAVPEPKVTTMLDGGSMGLTIPSR